MYEIFLKVVEFVDSFGYWGIFLMTLIESTFIPIPSEITLIPAGYLIQQGKMNAVAVWIVSVFGTLCGSLLNYYIAFKFGRKLLLQYGKYMFIKEDKLEKMEKFFKKHGAISMFTGRLLPGVKHFISFPAGLGKMNLKKFCFFTMAGAALWCAIILYLGHIIGENEALVKVYLKKANFILMGLVGILFAVYIWKLRSKRKAGKLAHSVKT